MAKTLLKLSLHYMVLIQTTVYDFIAMDHKKKFLHVTVVFSALPHFH